MGKHVLRGFFQVKWEVEGVKGQKNCVMNFLPDENEMEGKVITASHCLPDVSDSEQGVFNYKLYFEFRGKYVPIEVSAPSYRKAASLSRLINRHVVSALPEDKTKHWLPEYGANLCKEKTREFKRSGESKLKVACFSRQDLLAVEVQIEEKSGKNYRNYRRMYQALMEEKNAAGKGLPESAKKEYSSIWSMALMGKARQRNLRSIAFLSNVQFCASAQESIDPETNQTDPKIFCSMPPELREMIFKRSAGESESAELEAIRSDATTPLAKLREKYLGCIRSPFSTPDEETGCQAETDARKAFQKWVLNGERNLPSVVTSPSVPLSFKDYLRVVTHKKSDSQSVQLSALDVVGRTSRTNLLTTDSDGVFIFAYDPSDGHFSFAKGDSGSLLNIFGGYPVAALSTVDGEPTSGGTAVLPLPEVQDEIDEEALSTSTQNCSR
jgi:hypothetical protein